MFCKWGCVKEQREALWEVGRVGSSSLSPSRPQRGQLHPGPMAPMGEGWAMGGFRLGAGWSHHIPPLLLQKHLRCPLSWGTTTLAALEMLLPNVPSCAWHSSQHLGLGAYILIVQFYMMGRVNNSKGAFHPIPAVMPLALGGHPGEVLLPC